MVGPSSALHCCCSPNHAADGDADAAAAADVRGKVFTSPFVHFVYQYRLVVSPYRRIEQLQRTQRS
jgi:hypothetical protein